jgi:hypothetical protein
VNNKEHKNNSKISKKSIVLTPDFVAKNIYDNVKRFPFKTILGTSNNHFLRTLS